MNASTVRAPNAPSLDLSPVHAQGPQCIERSLYAPWVTAGGFFMSGARLDPDPGGVQRRSVEGSQKVPGMELAPF